MKPHSATPVGYCTIIVRAKQDSVSLDRWLGFLGTGGCAMCASTHPPFSGVQRVHSMACIDGSACRVCGRLAPLPPSARGGVALCITMSLHKRNRRCQQPRVMPPGRRRGSAPDRRAPRPGLEPAGHRCPANGAGHQDATGLAYLARAAGGPYSPARGRASRTSGIASIA
jgi:hypothetical protein